ncbi:RF-1 domain-containing protein [Achaetomium macrosporum]|uniref:RF-1 domain-containing protein n=1 Tax=Achaetomium macrosporum TaxID=79813 RepID=A0AAN7H9K2_9PEZI|nr:RF-1 domain-containing protein [Achaetomium macrosporum]
MLRQLSSLPLLFRPAGPLHRYHGSLIARFTTTTPASLKQLPPRPKPPPESEIEESFLKGSGPGGQKINKTNSAVQLRHIPTGIVVKSQATRSRSQNRKIARELLAARLDELINGTQSRTAIVSEVKKKRAASKAKKSRRKYRKLAGEKGREEKNEEEEEEEGEEEEGQEEARLHEVEGKTKTTESNNAQQTQATPQGNETR